MLLFSHRLALLFDITVLLALGHAAIPVAVSADAIAPVYKTGQTACYDSNGLVTPCAGSGQDGEHQAGAAFSGVRFKDNGDGTITDNMSGLIWLKDAFCDNQMRSFSQAITFAAGLSNGQCALGDNSKAGDWRLPNILELLSLVDYGNIDPALPSGHPFNNVQLDPVSPFYWSNTTHNDRVEADSPRQAFTLNMRTGDFYYHLKDGAYYTLAVKKNSGNGTLPIAETGQTTCYDPSGKTSDTVACAGSGQDGEFRAGKSMPKSRFTDNGDGTVTDQLTKLVWVRDANCWNNKFYWSKAPSKAAETAHGNCGLTDGSKPGDWRVPNIRELLSLMHFENTSPALPTDHPFINVVQLPVHSYYWTSTNYTDVNFGYTKGNLVLDVRKGYEYNRIKSDSWYLWLVRNAEQTLESGAAIFDPVTYAINIPVVDTGTSGSYSVTLQLELPAFQVVLTAAALTSVRVAHPASVNLDTGALHIPVLMIGNESYHANLQRTSDLSEFRFSVVDYIKN